MLKSAVDHRQPSSPAMKPTASDLHFPIRNLSFSTSSFLTDGGSAHEAKCKEIAAVIRPTTILKSARDFPISCILTLLTGYTHPEMRHTQIPRALHFQLLFSSYSLIGIFSRANLFIRLINSLRTSFHNLALHMARKPQHILQECLASISRIINRLYIHTGK